MLGDNTNYNLSNNRYCESNDLLDQIIENEKKEGLLSALNKVLTEEQRIIVEMVFFSDMKIAEVAKEVGISSQAVGKRLKKALQILREYVTRQTDSIGVEKKK